MIARSNAELDLTHRLQRSMMSRVSQPGQIMLSRISQMIMIFYLFLQKQQIDYRYIPIWVRIHCGVEVTKLSTNKQHFLSLHLREIEEKHV
jgi:hypothetical protein